MPAPEFCATDFDALLRRVAELEVDVRRRARDAEITAGRVDRHESQLRRLIAGSAPVADARLDRTLRQRALIAQIAIASGTGYTWKGARRVANIIAGHCPPPPGYDAHADLLRRLFAKPPVWETVWRHLKAHGDLVSIADITDD